MSFDGALLFCVESGLLESQALLLAESWRRWTGRSSNARLVGFAPRRDCQPSAETQRGLAALDVELVMEPLNQAWTDYPIANKMLIGAWAEQNLDESILVFADTDTVFLNDPAALSLPADVDLALRPVDRKGVGATGSGTAADEFWDALITASGNPPIGWTRSTVDNAKIRGYWNAGLVVARRQSGVLSQWLEQFESLIQQGFDFSIRPRQRDQFALAMVAAKCAERQITLPTTYNYPLPLRPWMDDALSHMALDDMTHVHYHRWFQSAEFLSALTPSLDAASERFRWLAERLPLTPKIDETFERTPSNRPAW